MSQQTLNVDMFEALRFSFSHEVLHEKWNGMEQLHSKIYSRIEPTQKCLYVQSNKISVACTCGLSGEIVAS